MPIIINKHLESGCQLGIWKITESLETLLSRITLTREELEALGKYTHKSRKIEWLSVRVLLSEMTDKELSIYYNGNRKPFIKGNTHHISISHSRDLTAILLSRDHKVGIDLEYITQRIHKIQDRFINISDVITRNEDLIKYHLHLHWCAKEALYKICDKQDINFRDDLTIEAFHPKENGLIKGRVKTINRDERFELNYFSLGNYAIVWTCK
jgi:4'-phosphopantetheinyl transferase